MIDLHVHSYYSVDAENSPDDLIEAASLAGVRLLAITDHNTVDHIENALQAAEGKSIRLLPGLELTCTAPDFGLEEVHLLLHFPQIGARAWRLPPLVGLLEEIAVIQAQNLDSLLTGLEIKIDSLERARQSLLESGRLAQSTHLALHLLKRCPPGLQPLPWAELKRKRDGVISNLRMNGRWLSFPRVEQVLAVVKTIGATATLAHPGRYDLDEASLSNLVDRLKSAGLQGLEAIYLPHLDAGDKFMRMAQSHGCAITCGSDTHSLDSLRRPSYHEFVNRVATMNDSLHPRLKWTDNL